VVVRFDAVEKPVSLPAAVRMADVARRASVSPATVSRVLNGGGSVGAAYRRRVLEAVEELSYRPNRLAQNLRRQRTATIGVVVSDIENPHFSEMVRAVEDRAYRQGYRVLVCNTDESPEKQRAYLQTLVEERVVGVVLTTSDPVGREISELLDRGIPLVAFDREVADARADAVIAENVGAARSAVELLVGGGHRRIAFVSGRKDVETGAERLDGYQLAMRAHGLEPEVVEGRFRTDTARAAVAQLMAETDRPTALIVGNNLMTLGALAAVQDAGITVPHHLALVAFDDPSWAALVDPPLTTLAQPVRRMATEAMELLLERISGARTEPRRTVHPFVLRKRTSCGTG
jgi:DNA-binding LacI/PurR family transcriptional regulator